MIKFFKNIKKYWSYIIRSAKAELKSEVSGSFLNWIWWILEPFAFMLIYTFVFGYIFKNKNPYFASFVMVGVSCWELFKRMILGSVKLISSNKDLVTKVYIPKYILLISKSFTYLFKFLISMTLAFTLMIYQNVPLTYRIIYAIPIIIVIYLISLGISMIVMHLGVYFSDLKNLTDIALKMIFYLSGVFYNINDRLSGSLKFFLLRCNPIAFLMNEMRKATIFSKNLSIEGILFWIIISIILNYIGIKLIDKNENTYVKVI